MTHPCIIIWQDDLLCHHHQNRLPQHFISKFSQNYFAFIYQWVALRQQCWFNSNFSASGC